MKMIFYTFLLCFLFCFCKNESPVINTADINLVDSVANSSHVKPDFDSTIEDKAEKTFNDVSVEKPSKEKKKSVPKDEQIIQENIEQVNSSSEDRRPPIDDELSYSQKIEQYGELQEKMMHDKWDKLLQKFVSTTGRVDYSGLKSSIEQLNDYLLELETTSVSSLDKDNQLAFWINAYNAYTVKLILDNYPVSSIMSIDKGKPWDRKWIRLDGKLLSLNQIENEIIRPKFNEPRIHFAVNCAAKSCPPLLNRAWTGENLEGNLEKQTKSFINNIQYNQIQAGRVKVSKIFEWYKTDFGDLISFLNQYSNNQISQSTNIQYLEYDWALNN